MLPSLLVWNWVGPIMQDYPPRHLVLSPAAILGSALSLHFLSSGSELVNGDLCTSLEWNLNYLKAIIQDCNILEVNCFLGRGVRPLLA